MATYSFCFLFFCFFFPSFFFPSFSSAQYAIDDSVGYGRTFDGIGGLSGGGATSRLLPTYDSEQVSEILDILFKPNYAASLHILKVEIGGDAQSTDGTESSHQHTATETPDFTRGYEWWLMQEAKARNPSIKLYGLPWAFPGWVGNGTGNPYAFPDLTAQYVTNWVVGARTTYGLELDYLGIWNERACDYNYISVLRDTLNKAGETSVKIVGCDGAWPTQDSPDIDIFGAHYPGTNPPSNTIMGTGKPLWASEDYSTFNDQVGGGCWARILNQNYVNGNMTGTISWNLIASYYNGLPFTDDGLMTAREPWSGHYVVNSPIWVSAHTTQFSQPGFYYLKHGYGAGHLAEGGSYVTLVDNEDPTQFSIIIEKMSHDHSICIRPPLPEFKTANETATFVLKGRFASTKTLYAWKTQFSYNSLVPSTFFELQPEPITVVNGQFSLEIDVDSLWTLTTTNGRVHPSLPDIPESAPFPSSIVDNFEAYPLNSEASYWTDQAGVWEIRDSTYGRSQVMRQVVLERPICWGGDIRPLSFAGDQTWADQSIFIDALIEQNGGVLVGVRLQGTTDASGVWFGISLNGTWGVWSSTSSVTSSSYLDGLHGEISVKPGTWYRLGLTIVGKAINGSVNGQQLFNHELTSSVNDFGWAGFGTETYDYAQFDNVVAGTILPTPPVTCSAPTSGLQVFQLPCNEPSYQKNQAWSYNPSTQLISLASDSSLCLIPSGNHVHGCISPPNGYTCAELVLQACDSSNGNQTFSYSDATGTVVHLASGYCLDIFAQDEQPLTPVDLYPCSETSENQVFHFTSLPTGGSYLYSTFDGLCATACTP